MIKKWYLISAYFVKTFGKKICVLKITEQTKIKDDAYC